MRNIKTSKTCVDITQRIANPFENALVPDRICIIVREMLQLHSPPLFPTQAWVPYDESDTATSVQKYLDL